MEQRPGTLEYRPPPEPSPPVRGVAPRQWLKENLFSNWYNSILTVVFGALLAWIFYRSFMFVFVTARWEIIRVNLLGFMVGRFPRGELLRPWVALFIGTTVVGLGAGALARATAEDAEARGLPIDVHWTENLRRAGPPILFVLGILAFVRTLFPVALFVLAGTLAVIAYRIGRTLPRRWRGLTNLIVLAGLVGAYVSLTRFDGIHPRGWGGLMLTMYFTVGAIVFCFPLGIFLALGRRSSLPSVRLVCVVYIEFFRGIPLIGLLVLSWLGMPFFFPPAASIPDRITRALIAFILFQAAYIAEIVRGGLQGVGKGQREAAMAVGLSPWKMTRLVVLPQALRSVIPALVGQFISLFKDTSLVFAIALLDLLQVARTVTAQPQFLGQGLLAETLLFVSFIYWVGSYWMSRESQRLERRLGVGER